MLVRRRRGYLETPCTLLGLSLVSMPYFEPAESRLSIGKGVFRFAGCRCSGDNRNGGTAGSHVR
jgi:hypothetical protein